MNAEQARQVLLIRAVEGDTAPEQPASSSTSPAPLWSAADSQWADTEALRSTGETSSPERFLVERARLATGRLAQRDTTLAMLSRPGRAGFPALVIALLLGLALLAGLATDALGPSRQVNLLAPPLLALMLWNVAIYIGLLTHAGWRGLSPSPSSAAPSEVGGQRHRIAATPARWWSRRQLPVDAPPAAHAFIADWDRASRALHTARLAGWLHAAALAVALGALLALYARGLVFEFKAGWDSTFVGAEVVHRWLSVLLAPAQAISGQALPDAAHIESLRFSKGGGENAARWIHWYAITTGLVMLPRLGLAAAAMWRWHRLQRGFPLPLGDRYFQRLLQRQSRANGRTAPVVAVLPYGHRLAIERAAAVGDAVDAEWGPGLVLKVLDNTATGGEDDRPDDWPQSALGGADVQWLVPLFALSATPERENQGAFIRLLQSRSPSMAHHPQWRVMIDESGFRQRLAGADLQRRVAERRVAWQKLLDELDAGPALFVDLGAGNRVDA